MKLSALLKHSKCVQIYRHPTIAEAATAAHEHHDKFGCVFNGVERAPVILNSGVREAFGTSQADHLSTLRARSRNVSTVASASNDNTTRTRDTLSHRARKTGKGMATELRRNVSAGQDRSPVT